MTSNQPMPLEYIAGDVLQATADALGDAYDCGRAWSAWSHGTMSADDFALVAEDEGRVAEIALAAINAWEASKPQPTPAIDLEQFRPAVYALSSTASTKEEEAEVDHLLALIDGQGDDSFPCCGGNDETPREHCMDCPDYPGQPAKGENAPAIDLEQFRDCVHDQYTLHGCAHERDRLLALIDGQEDDSFPCCGGNDETPREHCMDCPDFPGQPAKGENAPAIDLEQFRELLNQWKGSEYPLSYEGTHSQRALNACIADLQALIDGQAAPRVESEARAALVKQPTKGEGE